MKNDFVFTLLTASVTQVYLVGFPSLVPEFYKGIFLEHSEESSLLLNPLLKSLGSVARKPKVSHQILMTP